MAKAKATTFYCTECGNESPKWQGQCPACKAWNTLVEAPKEDRRSLPSAKKILPGTSAKPVRISEIEQEKESRISSGFTELDNVLGGGIVPASLILVGGDPGIGKSTLLLQVAKNVADAGHKVLYISGEESLSQIKLRADRVGEFSDQIRFLCETSLDAISEVLKEEKPEMAVIDSIQTMFREDVAAAPGSISQVRESTHVLLGLAKGLGITIFIVGHVTKEGTVAGPRMLEHMVDTVLYFEGDHQDTYRVIRGVKNRFGATDEIGVFEMQGSGLHEVKNPSEHLTEGRAAGSPGSVITCIMEGTRPVLLEVQALVARTHYPNPRRTSVGVDFNRVNLLAAVLEKRLGLRLSECDIYINIAGGMRLSEPSIDLAIIMAMISSYSDKPLPEGLVVFGEVGLTGEIRGVTQDKKRVSEAEKLGYEMCLMPKVNAAKNGSSTGMKVIGAASLKELKDIAF